MNICELPIASVRFDKTSYFYILPFFQGQAGPLNFNFRGPAQKYGALGYWAPVSLIPWYIVNGLVPSHPKHKWDVH